MPQSAGMTSELYSDADNSGSTLGAPPSAPAPVPPPTPPAIVTPVTTKARMADEKPDGSIRDTSTEALRPSNDLGFRNLTDESENAPKAPPPVEAAPEAPKEFVPTAPVPEKIYAERFKSVEELEKGYIESKKEMQKALAERDELKRAQAAQPPPPPPAKTPEQLATEEADKTKFLAEFVADPKSVITKFQQEAAEQTRVALAAQQVTHDWRKQNPDLAEHEYYVASEAMRLAQSDPEIAKDPARLMQTATANFRQVAGKLRSEGAKEALTQETRIIPLLSNTAPPANGQPPQETPLSPDAAFDAHIQMLKQQEQRSHRGLRR